MGLLNRLFAARNEGPIATSMRNRGSVFDTAPPVAPMTPPINPYAPHKPGLMDFFFTGPLGYRAARDKYDTYQQDQADQQDMAGLFTAMRGASDPRTAELDYIAQHPRLASVGVDLMKPKAPIKLGAGESIYDPDTYKPLASVPDKPPAGYRSADDGSLTYVPGGPADPKNIRAAAEARKIVVNTNNASDLLDPDSLDYASEQLIKTGKLPNYGYGRSGAAIKKQIQAEAARKLKERGIPFADSFVNQSEYSADSASLADITKMHSRIGSYEKTFGGAVKLARQYSAKVGRGNIQIFNQWLNAGRRATGDVDVTQLDTATNSVVTEYGKIMSGGLGSSPVSDAARAHARELLYQAQSPQQYEAALRVLEAEMATREKGLVDQEGEIKERMRTSGGATHKWTPQGGIQPK